MLLQHFTRSISAPRANKCNLNPLQLRISSCLNNAIFQRKEAGSGAVSPAVARDSALPGVDTAVWKKALEEYPELADVDVEHVTAWMRSAASLLKLTEQEMQDFCWKHPWLVLTDLLAIKNVVNALTRVLSVPEVQVARTALAHPDALLALEPMDVMEQLVYISNTTDMPYDVVVQLALGCPQMLTLQPRDVVRAWADVRSLCRGGGGGGPAAPVAAAAAAGTDAAARRSSELGVAGEPPPPTAEGGTSPADAGEQQASGANVDDSDGNLDAKVRELLLQHPGLLVMSSEEIRQQALGPGWQAQKPPAPGSSPRPDEAQAQALSGPSAASPKRSTRVPARKAAPVAAAAAAASGNRASEGDRDAPAAPAAEAQGAQAPALQGEQPQVPAKRRRTRKAAEEAAASATEPAHGAAVAPVSESAALLGGESPAPESTRRPRRPSRRALAGSGDAASDPTPEAAPSQPKAEALAPVPDAQPSVSEPRRRGRRLGKGAQAAASGADGEAGPSQPAEASSEQDAQQSVSEPKRRERRLGKGAQAAASGAEGEAGPSQPEAEALAPVPDAQPSASTPKSRGRRLGKGALAAASGAEGEAGSSQPAEAPGAVQDPQPPASAPKRRARRLGTGAGAAASGVGDEGREGDATDGKAPASMEALSGHDPAPVPKRQVRKPRRAAARDQGEQL